MCGRGSSNLPVHYSNLKSGSVRVQSLHYTHWFSMIVIPVHTENHSRQGFKKLQHDVLDVSLEFF